MDCPKCEHTTMTTATVEGLQIDRCPRCQGTWLDKGEAVQVLKRRLGGQIERGAVPTSDSTQDAKAAHCRRCDQAMDAKLGLAGVRFDYCPGCRGMFLDAGELGALQVFQDRRG